MRLHDLASAVKGELHGDGSVEIDGVAGLDDALEGSISYLSDSGHCDKLDTSRASAFVVPRGLDYRKKPVILADNPQLAFVEIVRLFHPPPPPLGVSDKAFIGMKVQMGKDVTVYPGAFIGDRSSLGDRVRIYPGAYIGAGSSVGDDTVIYPNVVVMDGTEIGSRVIINGGTVIGGDGYGFIWNGREHVKIPQVGRVVIGDDVEMGSNCAIDRAALSKTEIKRGTKIDNLVHIAHNCIIGEDTLLAGQVGFAGSVEVGNMVAMAGQTGVSGHLKIGDGVVIGGRSGVTKNLKDGAKVTGYPAIPHRDWIRIQNSIEKLPQMRNELKKLIKKIEILEKKGAENA